jgi:hypothetical protein
MSIAVTVQTISHRKRSNLREDFHATDVAVALLTADAGGHMTPVRKINKVGEFVDSLPRYRLMGGESLPQSNYFGFFHSRDLVTIHAEGGCRHGGMPRAFYPEVAVAAVDAHLSRVQLVGISNGLDRSVACDPSHRHRNKAGDQNRHERDDHDNGQVKLHMAVKPIPIRFHSSPWCP